MTHAYLGAVPKQQPTEADRETAKAIIRRMERATIQEPVLVLTPLTIAEMADSIGAPELRYGYDYTNQAWVRNGRYVRCGHANQANCKCYGRLHQGEPVAADAEVQ